MTTTVLNLDGYSDGTDISAAGFTREYQTPVGAFTINADGLLDTTIFDAAVVTYNTTTNDHAIEVTFANPAVSSAFPCCVNVIEYHSWYGVRYHNGQYVDVGNVGDGLYLYKIDLLSATLLASVPMIILGGEKLGLKYHNGKLTVSKNGTPVVGMTDITPAAPLLAPSTKVGMRTGNIYGHAHADYIDTITIESFPPVSITTVNGGNPVKVGSTFNSTVSGFTGADSGTMDSKALTGVSYTTNTIAAMLPSYVDGGTYFEPDTNQTLTFVNGSETANTDVPTASPDGMDSVVLATPNMADSTCLTYWIPTATDDDRIVFPTEGGDFDVSETGRVTCTTAGLRVLWHWNSENSVMTRLNVTVNDAGAVLSVHRALKSTMKRILKGLLKGLL